MRHLLNVFFVVLFFAYQTARATADEPSAADERIARLIAQLGSRAADENQAAFQKLVDIGAPAKPQLEAALRHDLTKIRQRAKLVLLALDRYHHAAQRQTLIDNPAKVLPVCWKKYRKIVGDSKASREMFADMYESERELLEAHEQDSNKTASLLERSIQLQGDQMHAQRFVRLTPADAAVLLVLGNENVEFSLPKLAQMFRSVLHRAVWHSSTAPDTPDFLYRKLAAYCIVNSPIDNFDIETQKLFIAEKLQLHNEGAGIATSMLRRGLVNWNKKNWTNREAAVIASLAFSRDKRCVKLLTPLLANCSENKNYYIATKTRPEPEQTAVQLRDLALRALVILTGQNPDDYGFL